MEWRYVKNTLFVFLKNGNLSVIKKIIDFLGANVRLRIFEKSSQMQHLIDSFNINTNAWVMHYVYKRLRFLQSKMLSQTGALVGSDCTCILA